MGFFDTLSETVANTGRVLGNKTKEVAGSTKLSFQITQEETKLRKAYAALGEAYYKDHCGDMPETYAILAADVAEARERLESLTRDKQILKNQKRCTSCGAWMANEDRFCGKCGAENEIPKNDPEPETAKEAAKEAATEEIFEEEEPKTETVQEETTAPEEAAAEEMECPSCHASVKAGLFYCPECGQKLS